MVNMKEIFGFDVINDKTKAIPEFIYYLFKSPIGKGTVSTVVQQIAAAGKRGQIYKI
jgi:hypothetical protein